MSQVTFLNNSPELITRGNLTTSELKFRFFSCFWAIATLFHMANHQTFDDQLIFVLLSLAALAILFKPSSGLRFIVLVAFQVLVVIKEMPGVSNHWIFTSIVNMTILFSLVLLIIKKQSLQIRKDEFYQMFAPAVRIEVIILYFFVVFHKLNSDFFFPELSCATELYLSQNTYSLLPESPFFLSLNAYFTIFIEALIPILLCFRKTRNLGIFTGLIFHNIIAFNSYNGFYDFSSMIFALYFLFSADSFSTTLYASYQRFINKKSIFFSQFQDFSMEKVLISFLLFLGFSVIIYLFNKNVHDFYRHIFWAGYSSFFIILAGYSMFKEKYSLRTQGSFFAVPHRSLLIFPLIVFLNGICPYLGLKTENSFAMFSNLRTEGGITNHFFVPASFQVFDYQKDLVEIKSSTDPELQKLADEQKLVVYYQFKSLVARIKPEKVDYIRNGQFHTFNLAEISVSDELFHGNSFPGRKFLHFRSVHNAEVQPCSH